MPHYKNGREAANGDHAIAKVPWPTEHFAAGVVTKIQPSNNGCNAELHVIEPGRVESVCVSLADCLRADDAYEAFDQLNPKPEAASAATAETPNEATA